MMRRRDALKGIVALLSTSGFSRAGNTQGKLTEAQIALLKQRLLPSLKEIQTMASLRKLQLKPVLGSLEKDVAALVDEGDVVQWGKAPKGPWFMDAEALEEAEDQIIAAMSPPGFRPLEDTKKALAGKLTPGNVDIMIVDLVDTGVVDMMPGNPPEYSLAPKRSSVGG
jgi:hypothetical protein